MQPQSATGIALGLLIKQALDETVPSTDPASAEIAKVQISQKIAAAVEQYVEVKLTAMASQLKIPSAFVGSSAAGPVVVTPGSFAAYDPKLP